MTGVAVDFMPKQRINLLLAVAALLGLVWQVSLSGVQSGLSLLNELRQERRASHSLAAGTRVVRPKKDLRPLLGLYSADVQRSLGWPTYCGHDESWSSEGTDCRGKSPRRYSWGPPSLAPDSAGPGNIVVTAGGPPLLTLDFSSDEVSSARWEEQR